MESFVSEVIAAGGSPADRGLVGVVESLVPEATLHHPASPTTASSSTHSTPIPTSSASSENRGIPPPTVPAACLACRSKHLKCDGQTPCSRCLSSNSECVYIASRRGYRGPRRGTASNPNKRQRSSSPPVSLAGSSLIGAVATSPSGRTSSIDGSSGAVPAPAGESCPMMLGVGGVSAATSAGMSTPVTAFHPVIMLPPTPHSPFATPSLSQMQLYRSFGGNGTPGPNPASPSAALDATSSHLMLSPASVGIPAQLPIPTLADRCLDSFYRNFHASHPFVLPKDYLLDITKGASGSLDHLQAAIRYIGSLYLQNVGPARAAYFEEALRLAYDARTAKDGFLVQTFLLLLVGLDGSCQQEEARRLLADAEKVAVQIALNTRPYATMHGRGIPVLEESWRRTWWDLYVVDGMIAGVHRQTNFLLFDVPSDVALPCEEDQYLTGSIPRPMYLEDLEDREFSGEEREFSSFAYRIAAARTLGKFMRVPPIFDASDENISRIEAMLTNWRMHLPPTKRHALDKSLTLDEMMFQAHMMTHATSILLHQPHSQLDTSAARTVNSCAPHRVVPSGSEFNLHTRHTIQSANEISKMVTHRVPLLSHSHFFTCVVTLSSIVHLSKWALFFVPHNDDDLRQLIRLNIGALSELSTVWKAANTASGQVRSVAQDIYHAKKTQQSNPVYWVGYTQEEVINSIAADETIMNDIEGLSEIGTLLTE